MKDEPSGGGSHRRRIAALIGVAVFVPVVVTANWRIASKAGYPPPLSLLTFVSPLNIFMLLAFAFREWPIELELRRGREAPKIASES